MKKTKKTLKKINAIYEPLPDILFYWEREADRG